MNALEMIAALKGADEETAAELVERLQCGEIDCSVLPTGKDSAVQQAQIWAQEARTQKGIVEEIGKLVGCANDWETVSAVKAALSGAQQGAAPQPAQVPEGWRLVPVEPTHVMEMEGAKAYRESKGGFYVRVKECYQAMLTAAPSGDAKREAEDSHECRRAELARRVRARVIVNAIKAAGYEDWMYAPVEVSKAVERLNDCGLLLDGDEEAARLRQSSDGDDSEGVE